MVRVRGVVALGPQPFDSASTAEEVGSTCHKDDSVHSTVDSTVALDRLEGVRRVVSLSMPTMH